MIGNPKDQQPADLEAWNLECTEAEYHADPCESPSLSASMAHTLVTRSAAHAYALHPQLGGERATESKWMRLGSARHDYLLTGGKNLELIPFADWRTLVAKEARDVATEEGRIPVNSTEMERIDEGTARASALLRPIGTKLLTEQTIIWRDEGVLCRSRLDAIVDGCTIIDVKTKTPRAASPDGFSRANWALGGDIQVHAYVSALERLRPELAGRIQFRWLIVETEPPYCAYFAEPDGEVLHYGEMRWVRARELWRQCLASREWPSYGDGEMPRISVPGWVAAQYTYEEPEQAVPEQPVPEYPLGGWPLPTGKTFEETDQ